MREKPKKIVYALYRQKAIKDDIIKWAKRIKQKYKSIKKIVIFGSLTKNNLGKYVRPFGKRGRKGSDIDILIITNKTLKFKWKCIGRYKGCDVYIPKIINKIHELHAMVYCPKIHSKAEALKKGLPLYNSCPTNIVIG